MKVAVTGASGLLGSALVPHLRERGHDVVRMVRGAPSAPDERAWRPDGRELDPAHLADVDAVVHLAGAGVADERWTTARKRVVLASRVDGTTAVARAVAASDRTRVLLSMSGAGYYGDTADTETAEDGPTGEGFLAEVSRQWEAATAAAEQSARVVRMRTGVVLARHGGALPKMLLPFRLGLGAPLGSGRQHFAWISLPDQVRVVEHLLTADVDGPVNVVAPEQVTNRQFTRTLNGVLGRPTFPVAVPGLVLRAALGESVQEMVLIGQRLRPAALERSEFRWEHPDLEGALRAVLGRPARDAAAA